VASRRAPVTVVVLAAGQGTRMRSRTIKLLHPVAGSPMVDRLLDAVEAIHPRRIVTVVGYQAEQVEEALADRDCSFVRQEQQLGTGHAVLQAAREIQSSRQSTLLVLNGDMPTLRPATLRNLLSQHRRSGAALTLLTAEVDDPGGYGRIVRDAQGRVSHIVEQADATRSERKIREINCGVYCARASRMLDALEQVQPDNSQGEYYITDAVRFLIERGEKVVALPHPDPEELLGVNTRAELARASAELYRRKAEELLDSGVTLLDPSRTWIEPRVRVGRDTVIYPDVILEGQTVLGRDCTVRSGTRISDCRIGDGVEIKDHSVLTSSRVGPGAAIGPFAHLRPGSQLGPATKVGNFVELKKTRLGQGSKASHLAYLGDATIGADCNIGAGTITCNYDGSHKHSTVLDSGVFIGSDTQLVAPVKVRKGAYVAAGTTVTDDVPAGALAIGRARQTNVKGWVARRKKK
jgi:bifunctional UDP-N-acetylglucosamine pyrophosphorylase/glucosamine-1-phosphate N-acetyltransferase